MATKEQINDLIDTLNEESYMDGYHQGFDEAWNESRDKGFDEGFEEADEQNANKIVELQEELDMMHEQIETSYNEGFEDGEDEERAVHERLLWEEINDAIPKAYAEGYKLIVKVKLVVVNLLKHGLATKVVHLILLTGSLQRQEHLRKLKILGLLLRLITLGMIDTVLRSV